MRSRAALALAAWGACAAPAPAPTPRPAPIPRTAPSAPGVTVDEEPPAPRYLRGSTHVHARPSGDSATPIPEVISWYERHGYDFIVLTDHNRVSEMAPETSTAGARAVRSPDTGLIVLAGIELTHNPAACAPLPPRPLGLCRIHVNALGVTARPTGRLEWAERQSQARLDQYTRALETTRSLGGLAQLNHPQWHWGMSASLLAELARRGAVLYEVANVQFASWNAGEGEQPSTEALWDAALQQGATLWGVASDDAHSYDGGGKYPAGGGWVMVEAARQPQAIFEALAAGRFYSSTGVVLARAGRRADALLVEVAAESLGSHRITFIANGQVVAEHAARRASHPLPSRGYVRAVVTRADGARAWVQPAQRGMGDSGT